MGLSLCASKLRVVLNTQAGDAAGRRTLFEIERLQLGSGQSLALYGPSGSGKTTLIHLLAGLVHQPGAQVVWRQAAAAGTPAWEQDVAPLRGSEADRWRLRHLGLVFQQFQLFATMSSLENVLTPYRFDHWRCPTQARERAVRLLSQFGVDASAPTGRLSRGEQQRVALARALVREPAVVLADEPTASLDPASASQVMDILVEQCRARGLTLIVATHDMSLSPRFDQALTLRQGALVPLGAA